jgi:hypothetical protein
MEETSQEHAQANKRLSPTGRSEVSGSDQSRIREVQGALRRSFRMAQAKGDRECLKAVRGTAIYWCSTGRRHVKTCEGWKQKV